MNSSPGGFTGCCKNRIRVDFGKGPASVGPLIVELHRRFERLRRAFRLHRFFPQLMLRAVNRENQLQARLETALSKLAADALLPFKSKIPNNLSDIVGV